MTYIATYEGKRFDYNNITKESIDIKDIFRSLPRLNRFVGHSSRAYSVGEHTLYCAIMAEKLGYTVREQLLTLIHDFTEAYVGDCPSPLKKLIPEFSVIEEKVETAICDYLGIEQPTEEEHLKVKRIDLTMLVIEMRYLTPHQYENYIDHHTHMEFIDYKEFDLNEFPPEEDEVRKMLFFTFERLMRYYKGTYKHRDES